MKSSEDADIERRLRHELSHLAVTATAPPWDAVVARRAQIHRRRVALAAVPVGLALVTVSIIAVGIDRSGTDRTVTATAGGPPSIILEVPAGFIQPGVEPEVAGLSNKEQGESPTPTARLRSGALVYIDSVSGHAFVDRTWPPETARATDIGQADALLAGPDGDSLWLFVGSPVTSESIAATHVASNGTVLGPILELTGSATPVAAVDQGVIANSPDGTLSLWDSDGPHAVSSVNSSLVAAGGSLVAWRQAPRCTGCPMHITDVRTGSDVTAPVPAGWGQFGFFGGFDPDAKRLAVNVIADVLTGSASVAVAVIDTATGTSTIVSSTLDTDHVDAAAFSATVFSSDGNWVYTVRSALTEVVAASPVDDTTVVIATNLPTVEKILPR